MKWLYFLLFAVFVIPYSLFTCCVVLWKEQSTIVLSHDNNNVMWWNIMLVFKCKVWLKPLKKSFFTVHKTTQHSEIYFMFCCVLFWWLMLLLITLIVITGLGQTPLLRSLMHAFFSLKIQSQFLYRFFCPYVYPPSSPVEFLCNHL